MHRTAGRPSPLELFLPSNSSYDRRKGVGLPPSHLTPVYLEAPVRDGLRTPPGDNMGTTYQHPQYAPNYTGRQESAYSVPSVGQDSYAGAYVGANGVQRHYSIPSQQPTQIPTTILRHEVQNPLPSYRQPASPVPPNRTSTLGTVPEHSRKKSTSAEAILSNLQIPSAINNSGGSLAEFAAQVRIQNYIPRVWAN